VVQVVKVLQTLDTVLQTLDIMKSLLLLLRELLQLVLRGICTDITSGGCDQIRVDSGKHSVFLPSRVIKLKRRNGFENGGANKGPIRSVQVDGGRQFNRRNNGRVRGKTIERGERNCRNEIVLVPRTRSRSSTRDSRSRRGI